MLKLKKMSANRAGYTDYYINGKMIGWEQNGKFSGFPDIVKYNPKNEKEFIYISIFFKMKLIKQ